MPGRSSKSLWRQLARSMALVTALLVAAACGTGYYLMARTLLSERCNTLISEVSDRADALEEMFGRQVSWLQEVAADLEEMASQTTDPEETASFLATRERTNGNITGLRAVLNGTLYTGGEATDGENCQEEKWYSDGTRDLAYLIPEQQDGHLVMTVALPVKLEESEGVVAAELLLDDLIRNVSRIKLFDGGYPALLDQTERVLSHPEEAPLAQYEDPAAGLRENAPGYFKDYDDVNRYFAASSVAGPGWRLIYAVDRRALLKPLDPLLWILGAAALLAAGAAWVFAAWRLEALEEPLRELTKAAQEMEKGKYKLQVRYQKDDEFGQLCRTLEQGCRWTAKRIDELSHTMRRMAQGDFTVKADEHYVGDFASVGESIDHISEALHTVFKQVNLTAKWALGGSHQVSGVSGRLSAGIESQTNSVDALGKAATLLRHECNQNALNAGHAQEMALGVSAGLRESARQTVQLLGVIREAQSSIRELNTFLETARQSAAQGRMLSISVSAEAERAGEQSQAFAVAVDELRELFVSAQKAAQEALQRLNSTREDVAGTESNVKATVEAIRTVTKKNGQTAEYIGRIASASQLQVQAASKMSKEVAVISVVIQSNAQLAEQFDLSCNAFSDQAKVLSNMASAFYTKGAASEDEKSAPIIFDEDSGGFSVTGEK